ncbi:MAG: SRPBCC family protein [Planctomycetes bacterium]|nr:SRPBCC family protein [Planctomycetota bacterium]
MTTTRERAARQEARVAPETNGGAAVAGADRAVVDGLGWLSIGLGLAELLAPDALARFIGVRQRPLLLRALGLRELASGFGILAARRPAPALWSRVVGDAIDLALLGGAAAGGRARTPARVAAATAAVVGVAAVDVLWAVRHSRRAPRGGGGRRRVVRTIAINRSPAECYGAWRDLGNLACFMEHLVDVRVHDARRSRWVARAPGGATVEWEAAVVHDEPDRLIAWRSLEGSDVEAAGEVRFEARPGGRGTLVRVELEYRPPAGALGRLAAPAFIEVPERQLKEDLRRFKQVLETGEVPTTEGQPSGRREVVHRTLARLFTGGVS